MAEAEDVITDVARHATVYIQNLWRRCTPGDTDPTHLQLAAVVTRIDALLTAVFGRSFALRVAQPPPLPTVLSRILQRHALPLVRVAVPATDGYSIWLPASFEIDEAHEVAATRFRTIALLQAMRAIRGSAQHYPAQAPLLLRELYLLLEARAAEEELERLLPGLAPSLWTLRQYALKGRPPLSRMAMPLQPLERLTQAILAAPMMSNLPTDALPGADLKALTLPATPAQVLAQAESLSGAFLLPTLRTTRLLWRDCWIGDLYRSLNARQDVTDSSQGKDEPTRPPRSARLARRPDVTKPESDEDDPKAGMWVVQSAQPHEKAEDPAGMQRPADRDQTSAAEEFADALSELGAAQLVSTPGTPKEVLLSDDAPEVHAKRAQSVQPDGVPGEIHYPEWDWRAGAYRQPGATVLLLPASSGPQKWVDDTLASRRGMLHEIQRRFELLRAQRVQKRRQLDGEDIDLEACIDNHVDLRAGLSPTPRVYQTQRHGRRNMAILLLVDVSGSTDGWIAPGRRIIDVEREALLLVCIALEGLSEPYSVIAFSGEGPQAVVVHAIKRFDERYDAAVAQRIAGLEPEHYTRAGAAIRHASMLLMCEPVEHRLLIVLSDGKPNDIDDYEGRYGLEDMRQAVTEAKLQGISPFCLTVDRQAAHYLPAVFGRGCYALLPRAEQLPTVLLDWLRKLVMG
jgi:nitric oxide reductase NorD protein